MARTKKQWMEKLQKEAKKAMRRKPYHTHDTVNKTEKDAPYVPECHDALLLPGDSDAALTGSACSLSMSHPPPGPPLPQPSLCHAVVRVEDISRCANTSIASMVKKQLAKPPTPGSTSPEHRKEVGSLTSKRTTHGDGVLPSNRVAAALPGSRAAAAPSASSSGGKNIFEQFDSAGRRSPRTRSTSPRLKALGGSGQSENSTRDSYEESRQLSVATAVRTLRGLSGQLQDKNLLERKERRPEARSRHSSPGSTSPRTPASASPKRQSPRRMAEPMSPPVSAVSATLKTPKGRPPSSAAESDSCGSPLSGQRSRSPRSTRKDNTSASSSPASVKSGQDCVQRSPAKDRTARDDRPPVKGARVSPKVKKSSPGCATKEHTIQILSSTSRSSKVIQLSPNSATRKLFVEPASGNCAASDKKCSASCSPRDQAVDRQAKDRALHPLPGSSTVLTVDCEQKGGPPAPSEDGESLLCAMLVGGSEVTKIYEQSREGHNAQVVKAQAPSRGEEADLLKPADSSFPLNSNDAFFDDDFAGDSLEASVYELPLLSRLPPLNKPNLAVLDMTEQEDAEPEDWPEVQQPRCHGSKTVSLLGLISRVKDCLPAESDFSKDIVADAECALQEQALRTSQETGAQHSPSSDDAGAEDGCGNQKQVGGGGEKSGSVSVKTGDKRPCIAKCGLEGVAGCSSASVEHCEDSNVDMKDLLADSKGIQVDSKDVQADSKDIQVDSKDVQADSKDIQVDSKDVQVDSKDVQVDSKEVQVESKDIQVDRLSPECPASPSSLGELDTVKMTQAATMAVQNHIKANATTSASLEAKVKLEPGSGVGQGPTSAGASRTSSAPGEGASPQPGPSGSAMSQPRSFFRRIASLSKQSWKPMTEPGPREAGRPGWSKWHTIMSPLPLNVLCRHEKDGHAPSSKSSAFASRELDQYLRQPGNRFVVPAARNSQLARFLLAEGGVRDYEELQRQISGEDALDRSFDDEDAVGRKSDDEEEEDDRDSELARKVDPDFDEVGGLVFVSFPSEMGIEAHSKVAEELHWEKDPLAYINMAKFHAFEESRRRDGKIRRESQGLRGQHMKWRKYQRLYRCQLRLLYEKENRDIPWPLSKVTDKTSDVSKIKNWKKKLSDVKAEDLEALEIPGEDDDTDRVKRKRKTYVFSSKKKKVKRSGDISLNKSVKKEEPGDEVINDEDASLDPEDEDDSYGVPIPIDQDPYMNDVQCSLEEMRRKEKGLRQNKGIFYRFNMGPEDRHIFKKLGGWVTRFRRFRRMPPELSGEPRSHRRRTPKARRVKAMFEAPTLTSLQVSRALEAMLNERGMERMKIKMNFKKRPLAPATGEESQKRPEVNTFSTQANYADEMDVIDLTASSSTAPATPAATATVTAREWKKKPDCDKAGCRYGCICHICMPSADSDEVEAPRRAEAEAPSVCDKEYCRLGCICDSLEARNRPPAHDNGPPSHTGKLPAASRTTLLCGKAECGEKCSCAPLDREPTHKLRKEEPTDVDPLPSMKPELTEADSATRGEMADHTESSGDELPTLEKTATKRQRSTDRYSNLPRRQTSYRMAKNLDAVSRKAMMMWETSEVYQEQTSNRRKKTPDAPFPPSSSSLSPSSLLLSPPMPTSTPTFLTSTPVTSGVVMATAAVSVNTLPSPLFPARHVVVPPPATPTTPISVSSSSEASSLANARSAASAAKVTLDGYEILFQYDLGPVMVSDEEDHCGTGDSATEQKNKSKRPRPVKRLHPNWDEGDVKSKKARTGSQATPTPGVTTTPSTSAGRSRSSPWHSSLICLRASHAGGWCNNNNISPSDDVLEEDEIKLFEFIMNCDWERSKREILMAVTKTLRRGVYPDTCTMVLGDFKVEILPKAHRPSVIPPELRTKLPKSMYAVRVRVTEIKPKVDAPAVPTSTAGTALSAVTAAKAGLPPPAVPTATAVVVPVSSVPGLAAVLPPAVAVTSPAGGGQSPALSAAKTPTTSSSSGEVMVSPSMVSPPMVGISGLGNLQITQSKLHSSALAAKGQHFQIQKNSSSGVKGMGGDSGLTVGGEKKKKKKKKKKKSLDPGDESLVPSLSNLTVSPRKSSTGATPTLAPTPTLTPTPTPTPTSTPLFRLPNNMAAGLRMPLVSTTVSLATGQPLTTVSPGITPRLPVSPAVVPGAGGVPVPVRPQVLGLSSLPPSLGNVKFLQLPGQNNLLQIVPASALGLKPMDNNKVPNFVAVPLSFSSVPPASPGVQQSKKVGSRVHIDVPSKVASQARQDLGKQTVPCSAPPAAADSVPKSGSKKRRKKSAKAEPAVEEAANASAPSEQQPPVKKKKKKKKKVPDIDADLGTLAAGGDASKLVASSNPVRNSVNPPSPSSAIMVASSPSLVVSSSVAYPVHMVKNIHVAPPLAGAALSTKAALSPIYSSVSSTSTGISPAVNDSVIMTTSEAATSSGKADLPPDKPVGVKEKGLQLCAAANSNEKKDAGLHDGQSATAEERSCGGQGLGNCASDSPCGMSEERSLSEGGGVTVADEDSRAGGEAVLDCVELSSESEREADMEIDESAGGEKSFKTKDDDMAIRRINEKRRRADQAAGFQQLWNALNVANNLPKSLSQTKILSKPIQVIKKTISLIEYHQRLTPSLKKSLTECKRKNKSLQQLLEELISELRAHGISMEAIENAMASPALPGDLESIEGSEGSGQRLHTPGPQASSQQQQAGADSGVGQAQLPGNEDSSTIIEIDDEEEEHWVVPPRQLGKPRKLGRARRKKELTAESGDGDSRSPQPGSSQHQGDSREVATTGSSQHQGDVNEVTRGAHRVEGVGTATHWQDEGSNVSCAKVSAVTNGTPAFSCPPSCDEVDGASDSVGEVDVAGDGLRASIEGVGIESEEPSNGEGVVSGGEECGAGMGLVITSVTSLSNANINFDQDEMEMVMAESAANSADTGSGVGEISIAPNVNVSEGS